MLDEVYVVVKEWVFDGGEDCGQSIEVFSKLESAKEWKKYLSNSAKKDFSAFSSIEEEDDEMNYAIWEEGEYSYNHTTITIYLREIDRTEE